MAPVIRNAVLEREQFWARLVRGGEAFRRAWRGDDVVELTVAQQLEARRRVAEELLRVRRLRVEVEEVEQQLLEWLMQPDLAGWRRGATDRRRDRHRP